MTLSPTGLQVHCIMVKCSTFAFNILLRGMLPLIALPRCSLYGHTCAYELGRGFSTALRGQTQANKLKVGIQICALNILDSVSQEVLMSCTHYTQNIHHAHANHFKGHS